MEKKGQLSLLVDQQFETVIEKGIIPCSALGELIPPSLFFIFKKAGRGVFSISKSNFKNSNST